MDDLAQMYLGGVLIGAILYFAVQIIVLTIKLEIVRRRQAVVERTLKPPAADDGPCHLKLEDQILRLHEMLLLLCAQTQGIADHMAILLPPASDTCFDSELRKLVDESNLRTTGLPHTPAQQPSTNC